MNEYPETIDNAWDVLYRDYPAVYAEFASFPYHPRATDVLTREFDFTGKTVLDVGSGAGQSAIPAARRAQCMIGIEPEAAMRARAEHLAADRSVKNVTFLAGSAEAIPLPDNSVDVVMAITAPLNVPEALRVVRSPGLLLSLDVAPGWYGGDLSAVIAHPTPELEAKSEYFTQQLGFSAKDFDSVQEYGTTGNILRTYGFIFGPRAIAHLKQTGQTSIHWRFRIHYRHV